ncbi:MAG: hypothetical protein DYG92_05855 [Leptolyngbya sp. PLA1]|nr:hypothetical protein [Leptolyngbya sp. PLA1]
MSVLPAMAVLVCSMAYGGQPPTAAPTGGPELRALVAAIEGYSADTAAVEWRQRTYLPPCQLAHRPTWSLLESSGRYMDERWNWGLDIRHRRSGPEDDWNVTFKEEVSFGNGGVRACADLDLDEGMLTEPTNFHVWGPTLWGCLGRLTDLQATRRGRSLPEVIAAASSREYLEPTASEPWPGIRARDAAPISAGALDLEVRVDPDHGFCPRVIRLVRLGTGQVGEETRVVDVFEAERGVWLPRIAIVHGYEALERVPELPPERLQDFERANSLEGLPLDEFGVGEALRGQMREIFEGGWKPGSIVIGTVYLPIGAGRPDQEIVCPQVLFIESATLTPRTPLRRFADRMLSDTRMYDGLTGVWTTWREMRPGAMRLLGEPQEAR